MTESAKKEVSAINSFMSALADTPVVALTGENNVIFVSLESTLESVLDVLHKNHILSVPAVDDSMHAVGFVDMLDVIEYIISCMKSTKYTVDHSQFVDELLGTKAGKLVDFSRRNNYAFVSGAEDLAQIAITLTSGVVHRVCTGRKFGDEVLRNVPLSVCTQADIIRFLSQEMVDDSKTQGGKFKKISEKKVIDMISPMDKKSLVLVNTNATLLDACSQIIDESVSVVGVVDPETGRLVGAFSPTDFKNWKKDDFGSFSQPLMDYLKRKDSTNLHPLTMLPSATLGSVIHTLAQTKCHVMWIVNDDYEPLDIITLTDVLRIVTTYEEN